MFVSPLMLMLIEIGHTKEEEDHYFLTLSIALGARRWVGRIQPGSCCGVRETVIHIYIHDENIETSDDIISANLEA